MTHPRLLETLRQAQRFGFFGPGDVAAAAEHANGFVAALGEVSPGARLVDLGSGGGLPGLVIADAVAGVEPSPSVLLIDRREKRTDFLERAVSRLAWSHVAVRCADVRTLIDEVDADVVPRFDVVTARGFGPPDVTLRMASRLIVPTGRIVISEPPTGDRWTAELLEELALSGSAVGAVRVFRRRDASR